MFSEGTHKGSLICSDWKIYFSQEDELKNAILVVLANKQDMEGAMSVSEIHTALGLDGLRLAPYQFPL